MFKATLCNLLYLAEICSQTFPHHILLLMLSKTSDSQNSPDNSVDVLSLL